MARSDVAARFPSTAVEAEDQRLAAARQVLTLLRRALPSDGRLELTLAPDSEPGRTNPARVLVSSPDAVARMLWPPSPDAFGEAYLRGDIDIEGDVAAAVDAGRSTWRLYMAAARRGFEDGALDVAQLLLARPGWAGPAELPLQPWWHG